MITLLTILTVVFSLALTFYKTKHYKVGAYYQITKNSYSTLKNDKGKYGEYLIYMSLRHLESSDEKFLFNVFIPKGKDITTEIDVLLICPKGLLVFECKNYSGWIFGNEAQTN